MRERTISIRQAVRASVALAALVVVGTVGYMLMLAESLVDALIRTMSILYAAGLVAASESAAGKIFTPVLVFGGVTIFLYVFGLVIELVVRGAVAGAWQERSRRRRLESVKHHSIISDYGRSAAGSARSSARTPSARSWSRGPNALKQPFAPRPALVS